MKVDKVFNNRYSLRLTQGNSLFHPNCKVFGFIIVLTLFIGGMLNCSMAEEAVVNFDFNVEVLAGDTLAVFIWPPVENLSVDCNPLKSSGFRVLFSSREVQYGGRQEISVVYMQPRTEGVYNVILSFSSNVKWNGTLGVYTGTVEFYKRVGSVDFTSQGYLITLHTIGMKPVDNQTSSYKINITLKAYSSTSSNPFFFKFPTPVNMALFILVILAAVYINAFFILDSFFKSRTEGISKVRWVLVGLLILASIYILYQIYGLFSGGEIYV